VGLRADPWRVAFGAIAGLQLRGRLHLEGRAGGRSAAPRQRPASMPGAVQR
jgi:hypothetical protein